LSVSNNVISFPRPNSRINLAAQTVENIQNNLDMMKHYHIQETILAMAPILFNQLDLAGFGMMDDEDEDVRDGAFIVEALRAIMCKHYGIYHPFNTLIENIFEEELTENGAYKVVDRIELDLTEPEETENE
jgi:hypothetical protein